MWLLTTDRAQLLSFGEPPREYAILSHVWRGNEQSFREVRNIGRRCEDTGENPRDLVSNKIRKCCIWAEAHGFKLLWIDTCCINKSSSTELSEAINSMFAWYARATVCYAYLHDVFDEMPTAEGSSFARSAWFTRGWTLQELIAPTNVIFLSQTWAPIASKQTIAKLLWKITGIDVGVLRGRRRLQDVSVAKRMSWAARRQTTRLEDRAYCLMGIFDVKMPTIYGEGSEAFIRLQEEIIKRTADLSILAWGPRGDLSEVAIGYRMGIYPTPDEETYLRHSCLLAHGPEAFAGATDVKPCPLDSFAGAFNLTMKRPQLLVSSYGVQIQLPVISFRNAFCLAVLPCKQNGAFVALILRFQGQSRPWSTGTYSETLVQISSTTAPNFNEFPRGTGSTAVMQEYLARCVLVYGPADLESCVPRPLRESEVGWTPTLEWKEIFIAYRLSHILVRVPPKPSRPSRRPFVAPCKLIIPSWTFSRLEQAGYRLLFPMSLPSFFGMAPGKQLCFIFSRVVDSTDPPQYSVFSVHIAADALRHDGASRNAYFAARGTEELKRQTALWCTVLNFCPPATFYGAHKRAEEVADWIETERNKQWPSSSDPLDPAYSAADGLMDHWRYHWQRSYVDAWSRPYGSKVFKDSDSNTHVRVKFTQLCSFPDSEDVHERIQDIYSVDLSIRPSQAVYYRVEESRASSEESRAFSGSFTSSVSSDGRNTTSRPLQGRLSMYR
ncbi:HET-domain-containing protein [Trametes sanguinea]|nr:HET-domain-containing protein [Trametes sanguinea]